jgi:cytochrome b pre-mRNA-processing protein 3
MLKRLLGLKSRPDAADRLYAHAVAQARDLRFYADLGVADRIDARFELYVLHVQLLILRLQEEGGDGRDLAQNLFDVFVSALDNDLRELGVGDLSVAKKMRKLSEQVYGRMSAYEPGLKEGDVTGLASALGRNVAPDAPAGAGDALAAYAAEARRRLAAQDVAGLIRGPAWPEVTR